ncbi:MAG: hypothetical protein ACXWVI_01770, partial [Methyloceanibacter sp.]
IGGIEFELELDLLSLARRVTGHNASHYSDATPSAPRLQRARDTNDTCRDRANISLSQSSPL